MDKVEIISVTSTRVKAVVTDLEGFRAVVSLTYADVCALKNAMDQKD